VALDEEYLLPQALVWVDAQITLADGDKNGEMQNRILCQLPKLDAIGEEKAIKAICGLEGRAHGTRTRQT
jgi:hypothetical protein